MEINIHTKFVTLIGTPLGQSFAARMQNRGYEAAGLNLCYFYTEAGKEHLGEIVNGLRYMNMAGFAVTKPNKVEVLQYLDALDPLCEKMGSCNTVVRSEEGKLTGYNTDGIGFLRSLEEWLENRPHSRETVVAGAGAAVKCLEAKSPVAGKTYFCIGSGGAGRAICSVLAYYGAGKIYIADISEESRQSLAEDINRNFAPVASSVLSGDFSAVHQCDVIINASGVGMGATVGQTPLPKEWMVPGKLYFDACYNPAKTQFLLDAEAAGGEILNGLDMSLYQGAAQIELWTGKKAPIGAMRQELINIVEELKS